MLTIYDAVSGLWIWVGHKIEQIHDLPRSPGPGEVVKLIPLNDLFSVAHDI
jgi:hypothetical protein